MTQYPTGHFSNGLAYNLFQNLSSVVILISRQHLAVPVAAAPGYPARSRYKIRVDNTLPKVGIVTRSLSRRATVSQSYCYPLLMKQKLLSVCIIAFVHVGSGCTSPPKSAAEGPSGLRTASDVMADPQFRAVVHALDKSED